MEAHQMSPYADDEYTVGWICARPIELKEGIEDYGFGVIQFSIGDLGGVGGLLLLVERGEQGVRAVVAKEIPVEHKAGKILSSSLFWEDWSYIRGYFAPMFTFCQDSIIAAQMIVPGASNYRHRTGSGKRNSSLRATMARDYSLDPCQFGV
ncbi:uncharacterized protein An11g03980 [Aspergillus niger]|uniref:Contig An11c0150, genomic contig n=2 Tax=Aspergillus niger TaxID=5061 RepID=A2QW60_ASPNC|nr:uncharacterized protein An11g03980 [Aspergillus niger]CAK48383.1 unnamed protein product [Aspergillus niger]